MKISQAAVRLVRVHAAGNHTFQVRACDAQVQIRPTPQALPDYSAPGYPLQFTGWLLLHFILFRSPMEEAMVGDDQNQRVSGGPQLADHLGIAIQVVATACDLQAAVVSVGIDFGAENEDEPPQRFSRSEERRVGKECRS